MAKKKKDDMAKRKSAAHEDEVFGGIAKTLKNEGYVYVLVAAKKGQSGDKVPAMVISQGDTNDIVFIGSIFNRHVQQIYHEGIKAQAKAN